MITTTPRVIGAGVARTGTAPPGLHELSACRSLPPEPVPGKAVVGGR
jgi:hypothetical protein